MSEIKIKDKKIELKPCPFCGNQAEYCVSDRDAGDTSRIHTIRCKTLWCVKMSTSISAWQRDYEEEVLKFCERWNTRVGGDNDTNKQ